MKNKIQFTVNQIQKPSEYNALLDKHLSCYFQSKQVIKTLNRGRLINKKGEILDYRLQKQYIRYHSEFPLDKLPLLEIQGRLHTQKQREKIKSQSVNLTQEQLSYHLNNTYLKKPEILGRRKII
ncbi:unnamed protein product [Paramecium octaurelia]|uniref:Uncharacterized protein n=1 Tax=Paramecium octaurelia TaxID=43137 RepID=A0A8S1V6B0_PAROT|nr:unnamed protein product [Paramecium octaurelia]